MKITMVLIMVLVLAIGCQKAVTQHSEIKIQDEGMQGKIEADIADSDSWCKAGSEWKFTGSTEEGQQMGSWKIIELVKAGKYVGLCHVIWEARTEEGTTKMDYYFSEGGEYGYYEIEANGQKIAQEWHK